MHFGLSDEQQQLASIARRFLAQVPPVRQRLERAEGPVQHGPTWRAMVEEHGWTAMSLPEEGGGWGFGLVELVVVLEEQGRTLTPSPLLSSCLAGQALAGLGGEAALSAMAQVAEGARVAVVLAEQAELELSEEAGAMVLSGTARQVLDGATAELFFVETDRGLVEVGEDEGIAREEAHSLDPTRPVATVTFDAVAPHAEVVHADFDGRAFRKRARVLLAGEQVGLAQGALDLTVAYAKVRTQFGRPIGAFQAVQHQLADMLVAVESARSAVWYAAAALDEGLDDTEEAALTALATASEAATLCAGQCIQLHGGIGFTWEHDAHLFFKRAAVNRALLGTPEELRRLLAHRLLGPVGSRVANTGGAP